MNVTSATMAPIVSAPVTRATSPREESTKDTFLGAVGDGLKALAYSQRAIPKFIYPSVFGTAQEKALIWDTLNNLPMQDAVRPITITVKDSLGSSNLLGVTRPAINSIDLNRTGYGMAVPENFQETLIHEIGHTRDYEGGVVNVLTGGHSSGGPWGKPEYVSRYASTMKQEDFAESYAEYRLRPDNLREVNQAKYDEMQRLDQPNAFQTFLNREEFRETGKWLGNALAIHPFVRYGLEFATQLAAMNLGINGVMHFANGVTSHDTYAAVSGAVETLAGAGLMFSYKNPVIGVAAMGLLGAHRGLEIAHKQNADGGATAAAAIAGGLGGAALGLAAPLGLTLVGYQIAGPIGGAIGLVAGGILGNRLGSAAAAHAALGVAGLIDRVSSKPPAEVNG